MITCPTTKTEESYRVHLAAFDGRVGWYVSRGALPVLGPYENREEAERKRVPLELQNQQQF